MERTRELPSEQQTAEFELQTQTIKSGLYKMMKGRPNWVEIKARIEDDVLELSGIAVEFSHYVHFMVYRKLNNGEEIGDLNFRKKGIGDLEFRKLIDDLTVKTVGGKYVPRGSLDPEYKEIRQRFGLRQLYDGDFRSQLIQKVADQYGKNFTTNLTHHSYDRVRKCLRVLNAKARDLEIKLTDTMEYLFDPTSTVENQLKFPAGCSWTRGYLKQSQNASTCLNYLKDFYAIQREFELRTIKNFCLVPLFKAGRKHLLYDKRAFLGVIRAIGKVEGSSNEVQFQKEYKFETHFNLIRGKTMGTSFSTDGVSICVHYEKVGIKEPVDPKVKKSKKKKEKISPVIGLDEYHAFIGIDPGLRLFIAATEVTSPTERTPFRSIKYSSKEYHKEAGFGRRRHKLLNWAGKLDEKIEADRNVEVERLQVLQDLEREEEADDGSESDSSEKDERSSVEEDERSSAEEDERSSAEENERSSAEESSDEESSSEDESEDLPTYRKARIEAKSPTFHREFLDFRLKWLKRKMRIYKQRKVARLKFQKDMETNATLSRFINERFVTQRFDESGVRNMYCVLFGDGRIASNSPAKGYRRVPNSLLVKKLKEHKNIHLYLVDEYNTTKLCSNCFNALKVAVSPHRYSFCPNCKLTWNRDLNAANGIVMLGIQELRGDSRQREFDKSFATRKRKASSIVSSEFCD